ncbi:hypothetical protein N9119_03790 [Roseivirga sp.]|jgi:hypothetical protein|nr:hypothetical protein [Roseivirga sp.]|tara:strand:+ start:148 stop:420 length:273 start_codon:yes stop_codon:yes gene_type:complete
MAGPIKAYSVAATGDVGAARARLRSVGCYIASGVASFTIKNGSATGETLLTQTFPTGYNEVYIPDDGILATEGVHVSAISGSTTLTIMLS